MNISIAATVMIAAPCAAALDLGGLLHQPWVWIALAVIVVVGIIVARNMYLRVSCTRTLEVGRRTAAHEHGPTPGDTTPDEAPTQAAAADAEPPVGAEAAAPDDGSPEAPSAAMTDPTASLGVCGACGKQLRTRLDVKGQCTHPGCGAPICQACWVGQGKRTCHAHE